MPDVVHDWVVAVVARRFGIGPDQVNMDGPLADYGGDSLDLIFLIVEAEEEFELTITNDELVKVRTPTDQRKLVENGGTYPPKAQ